jgi:hypothetical protein
MEAEREVLYLLIESISQIEGHPLREPGGQVPLKESEDSPGRGYTDNNDGTDNNDPNASAGYPPIDHHLGHPRYHQIAPGAYGKAQESGNSEKLVRQKIAQTAKQRLKAARAFHLTPVISPVQWQTPSKKVTCGALILYYSRLDRKPSPLPLYRQTNA